MYYNICILAATPLEASSGTLNVFLLYLKYGYFAFDVYFSLNSLSKIEKFEKNLISLVRVVVPSPKIVINLPWTYENLPC